MILFATRYGVSFSNLQGSLGMFFIKTGGISRVLLKWGGV
jgi:hypothetical protein